MKPQRIVVLGGSGFVGRHLVNELARRERAVVVVTRAREHAKTLFLLPRVEIVEANVLDATAMARITRGADAVVNLIGILHESRRASFGELHVGVTETAIRACSGNRVRRLLHMSSLNADPGGPSKYLRSKGEAEARVAESGLAWTIFQPSVIFGPEDRFLNTFATFARVMPVMFLPRANARFQPIYVGDVVKAFATALDDDSTIGQRYQLCGPKVYTLRELVKYAGSHTSDPPLVIGVPDAIGQVQAWFLERLPGKLLTRDNLASMRVDSICDCPFPVVFGARPRSMESVVPSYLRETRQTDRFAAYRQRRR